MGLQEQYVEEWGHLGSVLEFGKSKDDGTVVFPSRFFHNTLITSSADISKKKKIYLFNIQLTKLKLISGYVSRVFLYFYGATCCRCQQVALCCEGDFFPTKKLAGNACQIWKGHGDAVGLALLCRNPLHNPSASVAACTPAWPRSCSLARYAVSKLVCVTAAVTHWCSVHWKALTRQALLLNSGLFPGCLPWVRAVSRDFVFLDVFGRMVREWAMVSLSLLSRQWAIPLDVCCATSFPPLFPLFLYCKGLHVFCSCQDVFMFYQVFEKINVNEQKMLEEHVYLFPRW